MRAELLLLLKKVARLVKASIGIGIGPQFRKFLEDIPSIFHFKEFMFQKMGNTSWISHKFSLFFRFKDCVCCSKTTVTIP